MKVLHVISSVNPKDGGPIAGILSGAAVWAQHGHERHIVCFEDPDAPWVKTAQVKVFALGVSNRLRQQLGRHLPWVRYGYTPRLKGWLRAHVKHYDAVIVNGLWNYASFGSWRALSSTETPYFVFTHGMLDPWFNMTYPTKTFFKRIFWRLFEHRVLRDARGVMFTCEEERRLASQSFSPYSAREFVVGYGARDGGGDPATQRKAFLDKLPSAQGRRFILYLSRIHEKKGVDLLISAFAEVCSAMADFDLVIAGPDDGGLTSAFQKLASDLGVGDRVHWPGMLLGDAKWGAFGSAEFFVLPSHQENFGIVVAEALAMGRPVLITNKVNIWREIAEDGAGVVVNDDHRGIADGLQAMCNLSSEDRVAMGQRARRCFVERYDMAQNAMSFLSLLEGLAPAKAVPQ